jgi:hypothetical protein
MPWPGSLLWVPKGTHSLSYPIPSSGLSHFPHWLGYCVRTSYRLQLPVETFTIMALGAASSAAEGPKLVGLNATISIFPLQNLTAPVLYSRPLELITTSMSAELPIWGLVAISQNFLIISVIVISF